MDALRERPRRTQRRPSGSWSAFARAARCGPGVGLSPRSSTRRTAGAAIRHPETHLDLVRPGHRALRARARCPAWASRPRAAPGARLALSQVTLVKRLAGRGSGSPTGTATRSNAMPVATVPVGYADGYPRVAVVPCGGPDPRAAVPGGGERDDGPADRGLRRRTGRAGRRGRPARRPGRRAVTPGSSPRTLGHDRATRSSRGSARACRGSYVG